MNQPVKYWRPLSTLSLCIAQQHHMHSAVCVVRRLCVRVMFYCYRSMLRNSVFRAGLHSIHHNGTQLPVLLTVSNLDSPKTRNSAHLWQCLSHSIVLRSQNIGYHPVQRNLSNLGSDRVNSNTSGKYYVRFHFFMYFDFEIYLLRKLEVISTFVSC